MLRLAAHDAGTPPNRVIWLGSRRRKEAPCTGRTCHVRPRAAIARQNWEGASAVNEQPVRRRLTTILAADVVGYSRMVAITEEVTLKVLDERIEVMRSLLPRHNGRLFKTMGDGLLAEFASPVEAVRCAIEFQELMRTLNLPLADEQRIRMRIGINLGDVTVKDDDLLGDGVNIAARLEAAAPPDGICVSNGVFEQLVGKLTISSQDLGPIDVKNIPRPVHAHLLKLGGAAAMTPAPGLPRPPHSRAGWCR